jgi:serine/threonine protein kinase
MGIITKLAGFALRQLTGEGAGVVIGILSEHFSDQSRRLTHALQTASGRAWKSLEVALAGESLWSWLDRGEDKAFRQQLRAFLDTTPLAGLPSHGPEFRQQCLRELRAADKSGVLGGSLDGGEAARQAADLRRYGEAPELLRAEWQALDGIAQELKQAGFPNLAHFLGLRPSAGRPLLIIAVRYFFRRQVEGEAELTRGLALAWQERLAQGQEMGFAALGEVLAGHGDRLNGILDGLAELRSDVLDIKAEQQRQGQQLQELHQEVREALARHHLERRELHPRDSLSIHGEAERQLVRRLVDRYRALPEGQQQQLPALLHALGKLQVLAGDFDSAQQDFQQVSALVADVPARAEALYNAYHTALERRDWPLALLKLSAAAQLDPARFAPFPLDKYEPRRILGAGGFGVAFLCRHCNSGSPVVIKTLLTDDLDREVAEVFAEARVLEDLEHPAIIRPRDYDYADRAGKARPYLVMDYFEGLTLQDHVRQHGPLPCAELVKLARLVAGGLEAAHARGILHRDVKPANLLVRKDGPAWQVKLIDFGLALRQKAVQSTSQGPDLRGQTVAGVSMAGALDYAAPEQMGRLPGMAVTPAADVYGFAKTCCFALFGTPQPRRQHWQSIPGPLAELLDGCLAEQPRERPSSIAWVRERLDGLDKDGEVVDAIVLAELVPAAAKVPPMPPPLPPRRTAAPPPMARKLGSGPTRSLSYNGHRIDHKVGWVGGEEVYYDGRQVASGSSMFGATYGFEVIEDGQAAHYEVKSVPGMMRYGRIGKVWRNRRLIYSE